MAKVIKISEENYEILKDVAFKNRLSINHLADTVIKAGMERCKTEEILVLDRGHNVKVKW